MSAGATLDERLAVGELVMESLQGLLAEGGGGVAMCGAQHLGPAATAAEHSEYACF